MMNSSSLRRRVAVLMDAIEDDYQAEILEGISSEAERANVSLLFLAGGVVSDDPGHPSRVRNILFDLLDQQTVDGIVVLSGALGNALGPAKFAEWMQRFARVPVVNLGLPVPGMDSIVIRSGKAMERLVQHVIRDHQKTRVALIRGPVTSQDAEERHDAYRQAIEEAGLIYDPKLVVQGNWLRESGAAAVEELLGRRKIDLRAVGAIISSNDYMALGALDALHARGVDVPGDVLLTGFDDLKISRSAVPSLTTARQPTQHLGAVGLKRLLSQIQAKAEPELRELAAEVVHRSSCGCHSAGPALGSSAPHFSSGSLHSTLLDKRSLITAELARAARGTLNGAGSGWEDRLINGFLADMTGIGDSSFLTHIDKIIAKLLGNNADVTVLHGVLDAFRRSVRPALEQDGRALLRASDLFDTARRLIGDTVARNEAHRSTQAARLLRELNRLVGTFLGGASVPETRAVREEHLLGVGVSSFCMGVFASPNDTTSPCQIELLIADGAKLNLKEFEPKSFAPQKWLSSCKAPVLVQPLTWEGDALGLVCFPLEGHDGVIYEQVREMLSLALAFARLGQT